MPTGEDLRIERAKILCSRIDPNPSGTRRCEGRQTCARFVEERAIGVDEQSFLIRRQTAREIANV